MFASIGTNLLKSCTLMYANIWVNALLTRIDGTYNKTHSKQETQKKLKVLQTIQYFRQR